MRDQDLPSGWIWAALQDLGPIISGGTPTTSDPTNFDGDIPWITPADLTGYTEKLISRGRRNISQKGLDASSARILPRRSVVFSSRAPIGYVAIAANGITTNQGFKSVAVHKDIDESFVYFYLKSAKGLAERNASGTTFKEISGSRFAQLPIPVAPLNEQRRIVEKIETLFTRLDKGEEALHEVQKLLARYRQSVLKAAVTGQLTADWRAENAHRLEHGRDLLARILKARRETWGGRGKYKEPAAPNTSDVLELPEGWVWASVGQLAQVIGGLTKNKKRQEMPLRKPMLRVANVYQNRLELDDIHETGITEAECARVLLENLDLLVVEGNGSKDQIGRMAIWRSEISGAVHQNHLIKVRMVEKGLVEFALSWFQSPSGRQNIERVASSTSGLYTLSISKIESLIVPVPSLLEITEVNELVDEAFSKIEHLESWCKEELARSAALRQSILKDAFAGTLVPQDAADEPAADLLARIKEASVTAQKKTHGKASVGVGS